MENGCTSPRETVAGRERCCADEKRCAQSFKSKSFKLHHPPPRHLGLVLLELEFMEGWMHQWMM